MILTDELKPDLDRALERHAAWWECQVVDRACIQVTAPRENVERVSLPPARDLEQQWTDVPWMMARLEYHMTHTFFGGDALPIYMANIGPDAFAAFLGAQMELLPDTTWVRPLIEDWDHPPALELDPTNRWWQLQTTLVREATALARGRWMVGFPDTHTGGDAISALRGRDRLCTDLYDYPEAVAAAMHPIRRAGKEVYDTYFDLLSPEVGGSSSGWLHAWGLGRCNVEQCDFMALISPRMFQRFFGEWLMEELSWFDRVVWHLDGPECLPHLDYLLELPQVKAIQWVPGAGHMPMTQWIPVLQKMQAGGKALHLSVEAWEVEPLMSGLSGKGLMLCTGTASATEAQQLVDNVARWTHD